MLCDIVQSVFMVNLGIMVNHENVKQKKIAKIIE